MSSRALRRLQKQQEDTKALQKNQEVEEEQSEDEVAASSMESKQSAFAVLTADGKGEEGGDHQDEESTATRPAKSTSIKATTTANDGIPTQKTSKKKKKKKSKGPGATATNDENEEDDIDAVLASLLRDKVEDIDPNAGYNAYETLAVESQHLHAINEMRRLFGREAVEERPRAPQPNPRQRGHRVAQQDGRGFSVVSLKRNVFVQGKEEWPRATTGGLGMEIVSRHSHSGVTEYRFVHSTAYQDTQRQHEIAVASMDPQRLVVLLQQNPYHIATLLQVSEIRKHDRQHTEAGDVLERALFAFGRTVHSTFGATMGAGKARLDYRRPENREFFLACWRYIQDLSMRSTWRTVYEWAKLLFSLSPEEDPYAMKLVLSQYALRANQAKQYLSMHESPVFELDLLRVPSVHYSQALCFFRLSEIQEARRMLKYGIQDEKFTAHTLCKVLEIEPIPPALWAHHEAPNSKLALYSALYTTRAKDVWNTPEAKAFFLEVAKSVSKDDKTIFEEGNPFVPICIARHVYLTENPEYLRLLTTCQLDGRIDPREPGAKPNQDPFPPVDEIRSYDPRPPRGLGGGVEGMRDIPRTIRDALRHLPPEQMEAMMEELMRMQIHRPGEEGMGFEMIDEPFGADEAEETDSDV